jgi:hypothetical protein
MASFTTMVTTALFLFFLRLAHPPAPILSIPPPGVYYCLLARKKEDLIEATVHIV